MLFSTFNTFEHHVTYQENSGGIQSAEVEITGKVNVYSVMKAVRDSLDYYKRDSVNKIIVWSQLEEFTCEESDEFWNSYK